MTHHMPSFTDTDRTKAWVSLNQKLGLDPVNSPLDPSHLYDILTPIELAVLQDTVNMPIQYCLAELAQHK